MLFDANIQVADIQAVSDGDHVTLAIVVGAAVPSGPDGQMGILPLGILKFPMTADEAVKRAAALQEAAEGVEEKPPTPDIVVAQNLQGAERAARLNEQFRGS